MLALVVGGDYGQVAQSEQAARKILTRNGWDVTIPPPEIRGPAARVDVPLAPPSTSKDESGTRRCLSPVAHLANAAAPPERRAHGNDGASRWADACPLVDVILLHVSAPTAPGRALLAELATVPSAPPLVVISEAISAHEIAAEFGVPCVDTPLDPASLLSAIKVARAFGLRPLTPRRNASVRRRALVSLLEEAAELETRPSRTSRVSAPSADPPKTRRSR
jgi:hypothetical protein